MPSSIASVSYTHLDVYKRQAEYPAYCNLIMNAHADLMLQTLETGEPYPIKLGMYLSLIHI